MNEIIVNGEVYSKKQELGNRCVVMVDKGWAYAGDVKRENGRILLSNAVWIFKWLSIGFDGMIDNPKSDNVKLRKINNIISIPEHSELFSVHVDDNWGI